MSLIGGQDESQCHAITQSLQDVACNINMIGETYFTNSFDSCVSDRTVSVLPIKYKSSNQSRQYKSNLHKFSYQSSQYKSLKLTLRIHSTLASVIELFPFFPSDINVSLMTRTWDKVSPHSWSMWPGAPSVCMHRGSPVTIKHQSQI
jgi:hypothetical protein